MRILVTGGCGFIGSAVVRRAVGMGHTVLNVDALTYAACVENNASVENHPNYIFEKADIRDRHEVERIFVGFAPEIVIHLAAESHVDRSIDCPQPFVETNVVGTQNLLEAARGYWTSQGKPKSFRFHHVSTDEVFGSLSDEPANELAPYRPRSPYSASKAASDHLAMAWYHTYGLPVSLSICSNNYGPSQFPEKLIPVTILKALDGEPIPVYGRGENIRDWIYVEDHVDALFLILSKGVAGRRYAIGGGNQVRNIQIVQAVCEILQTDRPKETPYVDQIAFVEDRPGHDMRYAIDATRMREEIGWKPSTTMSQGLTRTVRWYLCNESWWRSLKSRKGVGERLGNPHGHSDESGPK